MALRMNIKKIAQLFIPALIFVAWKSVAGDLSTDVRNGTSSPSSVDGSYLELGMSLGAYTSPFYGIPEGNTSGKELFSASFDVNLRLQYKGWFVEGFSQSIEAFTFGYNLHNSDRWSFDIVALEQHAEISSVDSKDLIGLKTREADFMMGMRTTGYFGNYIVQTHALSDISEIHNGYVFSAKLARHWQYKNWNFHAIESVSYRSEKIADYYFSVHSDDATAQFPTFDASAGFTTVFEVGATYPLSQKWVLRTLLRHAELDSQWSASPLLVATTGNIFITSISYVY